MPGESTRGPSSTTASGAGVGRSVRRPAERGRARWLSVGGGLVGLGALAWILARLDYGQLSALLADADLRYLPLVPLAIVAEQLVRAWKWRQILHPLHSTGTLRLFGAIMAGYLANLLVPLGLSPLVRSWLVARLEALTMSAVLASVAIDRLIDGIVFAGLVLFVVLFAAIPDSGGEIRLGLVVGAAGSLGAIIAALVLLWRHKRAAARGLGWVLWAADRLPRRFTARARALALSFAEGIVWPDEPWRRFAIVAASLLIKLIAASHFLWAGLTFGVLLDPFAYLVLIAILGFVIILTNFARVPGGFIVAAVFTLGLFDVGEEQALAMVTLVVASTVTAIALVGAFTLWRHGVALSELRFPKAPIDEST